LKHQNQGDKRQLQGIFQQAAPFTSIQLFEQFVQISALGFLEQALFGSVSQFGQDFDCFVGFVHHGHIDGGVAFFICLVDVCACFVGL